MSKSKHTEAQIIGALKQVEAGRTAEDVAREQGVGKHTVYAWKAKYGGLEVSEAEEVKPLRDENARLKKLVADQLWVIACADEIGEAQAASPGLPCASLLPTRKLMITASSRRARSRTGALETSRNSAKHCFSGGPPSF